VSDVLDVLDAVLDGGGYWAHAIGRRLGHR
jgi:hypothetical protein